MSAQAKIASIIQARTSSSRLPNKVLIPLAGHPVIAQIHRRLKHSRLLDQIVLVTSVNSEDKE